MLIPVPIQVYQGIEQIRSLKSKMLSMWDVIGIIEFSTFSGNSGSLSEDIKITLAISWIKEHRTLYVLGVYQGFIPEVSNRL